MPAPIRLTPSRGKGMPNVSGTYAAITQVPQTLVWAQRLIAAGAMAVTLYLAWWA